MNTISPFVYLILALGCLAVAIGLAVWLAVRGKGRANSGDREQPPTAATPVKPETPTPVGEQSLLHVSRAQQGELAVFVRGQQYDHLREIRDPQAGREAFEAVQAVLAFAEGWLPALRQAAPTQPTPAQPGVSEKPAMDEEAFLEQLRQSDLFPSAAPGTLPPLMAGSSTIAAMDKSMRDLVSPPLLDSLLTPADQINGLVQRRLENRPDMAKHGHIRLTTGKDGGLRFHVGLQTFTAVDDIPDPKVRALIQDAIREWKED